MNETGVHDVDIPITDLDDNDDDLVAFAGHPSTDEDSQGSRSGTSTGTGGYMLSEDFENGIPRNKNVLKDAVDKIKNTLTSDKQRSSKAYYGEVPSTEAEPFLSRENIELEDYYGDSDEGNKRDNGLVKGLGGISEAQEGSLSKKLFFFFSLFLFIGALVSSSVVLANRKQSQLLSSLFEQKKPILSNGTHQFYPTTIMISLDGFHPHYISSKLTPFMHNLYINSYGPPYMTPSFPSSTFPNHWSIVTGLYPAYHGIVGNTFYDPKKDKQFINVKKELSMDSEWWGGEPIWRTAYSHGVSSAVHMWPGSEVQFDLGNPLEVDKYNGSEILSRKMDRILGWIDRDIETRPELMLGYVPTIDSIGHKNGIAGKALKDGLKYVDNFIESIIMEIKERNLTDIINFVVVSDHGMSPTSSDRLIILDDIVDLNKIQHTDGWPLFGLRPYKQFSVDEVYESVKAKRESLLNDGKDNAPHFQVFKKEEMPEAWNFGTVNSTFDDRIAPIWIVPDIGYAITTKQDLEKTGGDYKLRGIHGYNNTEVLMRALFLGTGPYFFEKFGKGNHTKVEPFQNTQVYNMLCDMLKITPNANNGSDPNVIFNIHRLVKQDWNDPLGYPNVDFKIDYIKEKSTYDLLFRKAESGKAEKVDVHLNPTASLLSIESSIGAAITPVSEPGATFKPDLGSAPPVPSKKPTITLTASDSKTTAVESGSPSEVEEEPKKTGETLFDLIGDVFEELEEDAKEIFDDFKGAISNLRGGHNDDDK